MSRYPAWVLDPTDAELLRYFGPRANANGQAYAREQRISHINVSENMITAQIRGSYYSAYRTVVEYLGSEGGIFTSCSCPVRDRCKHGAALLWHARNIRRSATTPSWQKALNDVLVDSRDGESVQLALLFEQDMYGLGMTPLRWGKTGRWVKSGAAWRELRHGWHFNPAQVEVLNTMLSIRNIAGYGYPPERLHLGGFGSELWRLLRAARDTGIVMLTPDGLRDDAPAVVFLDEPLEPTMSITRDEDATVVAPVVVIDGHRVPLTRENMVGTPMNGVQIKTAGGWLLGPLARILTQREHGLVSTGEMRIPAPETAIFASGYLPGLRQRFRVDVAADVELPQIEPPQLRLEVAFSGHTAILRWAFRYRFGGQEHHLGPVPRGAEPRIRDAQAETALVRSLPPGPWRSGHAGPPTLLDVTLQGRDLIGFTTDVLPVLLDRDDVHVELNEEAPRFHEAEEPPAITLTVEDSRQGDWFDLEVEVVVAGQQVPLAQLMTALATGHDHMILENGTWFSLEVTELDRLRTLIDEARQLVETEGNTFRLRPEHAGLWQELVELGVVARQSEVWSRSVAALLDHTALPNDTPPDGLQAALRPYQREGFAWLRFLWHTRLGGILADEMGLGKTLQSLALAQAALEAGELERPILVVVPTSMIGTWASEAAKFAPGLNVVAITETAKRRDQPLPDLVDGTHLVVTSYTLLRLEADEYLGLSWSGVLLDEAQFVKNPGTKAYQAIRRLNAPTKVALTGTPLENNLMDLWSLLSITAPGLFPDPKAFTESYRKPIEAGDTDVLARLHRRIRPLILRRTKSAVAKELPDKQEQVVTIPLAPAHRKIYDRHLTRERQKVLGLVDDLNRNRITILRSLTLLRQLALAPSLVDQSYPATSAKIDALLAHLEELAAAGHRALVFSQFTGFLSLVRQRLVEEGIAFEYLDGRTRDRTRRIEQFRSGRAPVFLVSLKAGGFGLTLTEADYVFILDPWWNPAAENQAIDRTHRIGQDQPVNVYRMVSANTIEERVVALQQRKRNLFDAVVSGTTDLSAPLTADDIRGLLDT